MASSKTAPGDARDLARAVERWFAAHARELPWRRDARDPVHGPYRVWVSEIMLQQTQVATVIPYYERWMQAFPTLAALAAAPLETVLAHWSGLGYYARCRNLHKAAREVVEKHGGRLPRDPEALRALPGVGPYTVGALRSIAFGEKAPLVDGNVIRVLSRLDAREGDPAAPGLQRALWARAAGLVEAGGDPSALNQGLMELGATVCTPAAPACALCPLEARCLAHAQGRADALPQPTRRPGKRAAQAVTLVARRPDGALLLGRRPERGLLGGLWEPVQVPPEAARAAEALGTVRHVFTHLDLTLHVFGLRPAPGDAEPTPVAGLYEEVGWVAPEALAGLPLSNLARKVLKLAGL